MEPKPYVPAVVNAEPDACDRDGFDDARAALAELEAARRADRSALARIASALERIATALERR